MAKLSDRQKKNIIALYKTGEYNKTQLAKKYKVDEKTIRNITENAEPSNADIVEAGVNYEVLKKSVKSPTEIKAIEKVVDDKTKHLEFFKNATLKNASVMMKKVDGEMAIHEHKAVQETLDKGMISMGLADRHAPRMEVTNNTGVQVNDKRVVIARRSDRAE